MPTHGLDGSTSHDTSDGGLDPKRIRLWADRVPSRPTYLPEWDENGLLRAMEAPCDAGMLSHPEVEDGRSRAPGGHKRH
jgi:hypothetical protein